MIYIDQISRSGMECKYPKGFSLDSPTQSEKAKSRQTGAGPFEVEIAWCLRAHAANSSSNAFASFRSRVSNPSVNHP
jgi:hypothetical protein